MEKEIGLSTFSFGLLIKNDIKKALSLGRGLNSRPQRSRPRIEKQSTDTNAALYH
jgi:hypothetical protein